jgi:hypothetical protein
LVGVVDGGTDFSNRGLLGRAETLDPTYVVDAACVFVVMVTKNAFGRSNMRRYSLILHGKRFKH